MADKTKRRPCFVEPFGTISPIFGSEGVCEAGDGFWKRILIQCVSPFQEFDVFIFTRMDIT